MATTFRSITDTGRTPSSCPSGASYWICGNPSGTPSPFTTSVECMCSPSVPAEPLFLPIKHSPTQPGCSAKFKSVPSWMHSTATSTVHHYVATLLHA